MFALRITTCTLRIRCPGSGCLSLLKSCPTTKRLQTAGRIITHGATWQYFRSRLELFDIPRTARHGGGTSGHRSATSSRHALCFLSRYATGEIAFKDEHCTDCYVVSIGFCQSFFKTASKARAMVAGNLLHRVLSEVIKRCRSLPGFDGPASRGFFRSVRLTVLHCCRVLCCITHQPNCAELLFKLLLPSRGFTYHLLRTSRPEQEHR